MNLSKTQMEILTRSADQMGLTLTAVVEECVTVGGVCVSRADLGQCTGHTVRRMTSLARTKGDLFAEVREPRLKNRPTKIPIFEYSSVTNVYPSLCPPQGGVCVCRASVCAWTAGQVIAAVVPSLQRPVNQPTACFAAGEADVCAGSACAKTPNTLEKSVRNSPTSMTLWTS